MFCIKSDVITLGSIEMYGLVTVWTSMDDGLYWVILLKYGCHAPNPGPTRLADPNRFPGRETPDWDSLPDFFFF